MYVLFLCSSKMEYVAMVVCYSRCQLELIAQIIDFFLNINVNVKKNLQNKKDSPFLLKPIRVIIQNHSKIPGKFFLVAGR